MSYIDGDHPIPKHAQLREILARRIKAGEFLIGDKLPGEQELSKEYSVSRATVRRALSDLITQGVLFSHRGKGTFVVRPQHLFRSPSSSIPHVIAFVTYVAPHLDYVSGSILRGIEQTALLNGYYVISACSNESVDWEKYILKDLTKIVDGLIIRPSHQDYKFGYEHIAHLCDMGMPFVLVDNFFKDLPTDYVVSDNQMGAYEAVTHLIGLGHRRIGYVMPAGYVGTSGEDRLSGYKNALVDHGLSFEPELVVKMGREGKELRSLLRSRESPTAFFCMADLVALKVIRIIEEEKKKVPEDVAVVGHDDMDILRELRLGLTTVRQPLYEEGKMAVMKLMNRIRQNVSPEEPQQVVLRSTMVIRESCGSPRR